MPDYSLPLILTLICGQGRCGKTTFAIRYLLNVAFACRFIFDDRGQVARRLKLKPCGTEGQCNEALASRWVCFNPHVMFPGEKLADGFRWFCHWVFETSKRGPGRKVLFVDELWQWVSARRPPPAELQNVIRTGPVEGLELLAATHSPKEFHEDIRRFVTEWVCFNMVEPNDIDAVKPYFSGVTRCATLPKGQFLAYDRENGTELTGRVF